MFRAQCNGIISALITRKRSGTSEERRKQPFYFWQEVVRLFLLTADDSCSNMGGGFGKLFFPAHRLTSKCWHTLFLHVSLLSFCINHLSGLSVFANCCFSFNFHLTSFCDILHACEAQFRRNGTIESNFADTKLTLCLHSLLPLSDSISAKSIGSRKTNWHKSRCIHHISINAPRNCRSQSLWRPRQHADLAFVASAAIFTLLTDKRPLFSGAVSLPLSSVVNPAGLAQAIPSSGVVKALK